MNVRYGQNIFDVVVSQTGNINNIFQVLSGTSLDIDSTIQSGQEITIPQVSSTKETFITTSNPEIEKEYYAQDQQNLFDLTCQYYGDLSFLFDFIADNSFDLTTIIQTRQKILLHNANKGNEKVKKFVILNQLVFANQGDVITRILAPGKAFSHAFSKAFH